MLWLTCGWHLGSCLEKCLAQRSETIDYKAAWTAFLAQTGPQGGCAAETVPLTHFLRRPMVFKFKTLTLNGLSVWQVMIGKGCRAQFTTSDLEKRCRIGHVQQNFGGSYSTTKQACFMELGISHLSRLHSSVAFYSYCKPSDSLTSHPYHGTAVLPNNWTNAITRQAVGLYVLSICLIHLEELFTII